MEAIDITLEVAQSVGTAYYRLDDEFKNFLDKIEKDKTIIGFEYESGSRNFGVIVAEKK